MPLPQVVSTKDQNPWLDSLVSAQHKSTGSLDRNQSRYVSVLFVTVCISLWIALKHFQYLKPQVLFTENQHPWLDSQFSHTVKALRVDRLECHLELFGNHWELIWNDWNTLWLGLHPLWLKIHRLTVLSPPNVKAMRVLAGISVGQLQFHLELFGFYSELLLNTCNTPCLRIYPLRINIHGLTLCSTKCKLTGSPDCNQRRSVPVPSGTFWNSLGIDLDWQNYPLSQASYTPNPNPWLDSLFSPTVKAPGVQTGIGVYLL